ncbi:hypothetical protein CC80DRAFT_599435 [Byssothecium circinans]|uniref:Uncharacterized protein n=1 Tax=Byssothecium circinans TaxID=147558 RepID=A0A6A5T7X5_9PLEO|nr:hypothetical protein CC80DRAFT_599435 [Byssothecium circinans]
MPPQSFAKQLSAFPANHTVNPSLTLFPLLPLELREQIYTHSFHPFSPTTPFQVHITHRLPLSPPLGPEWLPSVCTINPTLWVEVGLWFIRNADFSIDNADAPPDLANFLDTFPGRQGWETVRRVSLTHFSLYVVVNNNNGDDDEEEEEYTKNPYISFLLQCTYLASLTIHFDARELLHYPPHPVRRSPKVSPFAPTPATVSESQEIDVLLSLNGFSALFGMDELFNAQSLNRIMCVVSTRVPDLVPLLDSRRKALEDGRWVVLVEGLAERWRDEFEERGRRVEVLVGVEKGGNRNGDGDEERRWEVYQERDFLF